MPLPATLHFGIKRFSSRKLEIDCDDLLQITSTSSHHNIPSNGEYVAPSMVGYLKPKKTQEQKPWFICQRFQLPFSRICINCVNCFGGISQFLQLFFDIDDHKDRSLNSRKLQCGWKNDVLETQQGILKKY